MPSSTKPIPDDEPEVAPHPSEAFRRPSDVELAHLRILGDTWNREAPDTLPLPVEPSLSTVDLKGPRGAGRIETVQLFRAVGSGEVQATLSAGIPESHWGQASSRLRHLLIGPPLASAAIVHERMRKLVALPVLSSDLLSSVAYGPEAMLTVLVLAGAAGLRWSLLLGAGLTVLMLLVGVSYRQTIRAYPSGAGSYLVAGDNLGELAGICAGVGLLTDYVLTVSVSVAAGIAAITSAVPFLRPDALVIPLGAISVLLVGNLRGVRQAGNLFAWPTYMFFAGMCALIAAGLAQFAGRDFMLPARRT
jgi:hypothetical protein